MKWNLLLNRTLAPYPGIWQASAVTKMANSLVTCEDVLKDLEESVFIEAVTNAYFFSATL